MCTKGGSYLAALGIMSSRGEGEDGPRGKYQRENIGKKINTSFLAALDHTGLPPPPV